MAICIIKFKYRTLIIILTNLKTISNVSAKFNLEVDFVNKSLSLHIFDFEIVNQIGIVEKRDKLSI